MKRREFITLLGGAAAAWPLAARAQQPGKLPSIGFVSSGTPSTMPTWSATFVQRLRELGWVEGRTMAIEFHWAEGRTERYAAIGSELVRRKIDVIVAPGNMVPAIKQATSSIPIVFPVANDPLATGLVTSLARPGGNVTGMSLQSPDIAGKRIELLREILPSLRRLSVLFFGNRGNVPEVNEIEHAAQAFDLELTAFELHRAADIAPAFGSLAGQSEALYIVGNPLAVTFRTQINILAASARLPTVYSAREYVEAGGLMSYGPSFSDLYRRAAEFVDKILRGAKPADIPVEQPTRFELVVNLTAAKALRLTIPETFLVRADEVIE